MIVTVTLNPVLDRTLTVPRILFNEVSRAKTVHLDCGGKGFNVSRALRALGTDSVAMGFVGGATGRTLQQGLEDLGVETDLVPIAGETRTNIVVREQADSRYIKVNEAGPDVSEEEWERFLDRARTRARSDDTWVLSGTLPPGLPTDFYERLIELLRQQGARAFLDSSGEPFRLGCSASPYLVKPNASEAQEATGVEIKRSESGRATGALVAVEGFLDQGVELVALSLGEDGLLLANRQEAVWATPNPVVARNPTGAGDALLAGIIWAQTRGASFEEMARWGVAAGTASAADARVSAASREDVEAWYRHVETSHAEGWGIQ